MKATISICDFYYYKPTGIYIHIHPNLGQQSICAWLPFFERLKSLVNGEGTNPSLCSCFGTFMDFFQPDNAFWKFPCGLISLRFY